jgi:hypothetical protein
MPDLRALEITSTRLCLRSFKAEDAAESFAEATPTLTRFMGWDPSPSHAAFAEIWRGWPPKMPAVTDLALTVRLRSTDEFMSMAGLHCIGQPEPEIGIWVKEAAHGTGYGREAVAAPRSALGSPKADRHHRPALASNAPSTARPWSVSVYLIAPRSRSIRPRTIMCCAVAAVILGYSVDWAWISDTRGRCAYAALLCEHDNAIAGTAAQHRACPHTPVGRSDARLIAVLRAGRCRHEAGALVERHWSLIERVAAALLAHGTVRGKVEAAYRRADFFEKRRRLMIAWARFAGRNSGLEKRASCRAPIAASLELTASLQLRRS